MQIENRKIGLDVLRSIAIHLVIFGHVSNFFNSLIHIPILGNIIGKTLAISEILAYLGVELFFVLSGFLISKILLDSIYKRAIDFSIIKKFWIRRWLRTLPNYYWLLGIKILIYILILNIYNFDWRFLLFLQNLFTAHPQFFREAWSLAVEEWYYIFFPIVIFSFSKCIKNTKHAFVLSIFALIFISVIAKILLLSNSTHHFDEEVRKVVLYRMDSLAIGALACWLFYYNKNIFLKYKNILLIFSIVLFVLFINLFYVVYENNYEMYYQNRFVAMITNFGFSPIFAVIFVLSFPYFYQICKLKFGTSFFTFTSKISYSMYLIHLLVYHPINHYEQWIPKNILGSIGCVFIYYLLVYILSFCNYLLVEQTFLKLREAKFPNNQ